MNDELGPGAVLGGIVATVVCLFLLIGGGAWLFSFKGTDSGEICVVREGGPFDGRSIKEVRQPGEGPKAIGAFNHQDCLPTTERDSNDVIEEDPTFPTKDSVQVVADGQALFTLTTDADKIETFFKKFGRRKWGGEDIGSDEGWLNFLRQRFAPVVLDTQREVLGQYDCISLNNLCVYVQNPEAAIQVGDGKKIEGVNNTQNLSAAAKKMADVMKMKLRAAFGDDYFENVRYQNLRIRFETEVQKRIVKAQTLRTDALNAKLGAEKIRAEAKGEADRLVEQENGKRRAAFQQQQAYKLNPTAREIDKIKAFCGPDGCNPAVIGDTGKVITNLGK